VLAGVDAGLEHADVARALRHDGPVALVHLQAVGVGQPLGGSVARQAVEAGQGGALALAERKTLQDEPLGLGDFAREPCSQRTLSAEDEEEMIANGEPMHDI
jgi:hypothetical protein